MNDSKLSFGSVSDQ